MRETAYKVEGLHDYEAQIERHIKMQRLCDVHKLNDQTEPQSELSGKTQLEAGVDEDSKQHCENIQRLSSCLIIMITEQQLGAPRKLPSLSGVSQYAKQTRILQQANTRFEKRWRSLKLCLDIERTGISQFSTSITDYPVAYLVLLHGPQ
ncbi:hypothetical protein NLI96_g7415 [Meripilus lineatus]|uniref:Uncharacterized protein n=1 Tax=Meripilus lineatus TaxID=2056292 RepID=A0AAD5UZ56_9APHY|nr:hypothetical protein NLI96_g7415 [Physisporinus lineatus]